MRYNTRVLKKSALGLIYFGFLLLTFAGSCRVHSQECQNIL
jgi:hypothetical protein